MHNIYLALPHAQQMLAFCLNIMKSLLALDSHISYTNTCAKFCCKLQELYLDQVDHVQIEKLECVKYAPC
jgi:hypothetical protein